MRKPKFVGTVALTLAFAFAPSAFAAKATKSEEAKKTEAKEHKQAEGKDHKHQDAAETKPSEEVTSSEPPKQVEIKTETPMAPPAGGHLSMRGGAALGEGSAMRLNITAGTQQNINSGLIQLEFGMLWALAGHLDVGFNVRAPLYSSLGFSPGASVRWTFIDDQKFHLALVGNFNVPMLYVPGFSIGLSIEPGIAMSYFFSDNVELYSALLFTWSPIFRSPWVPGSANSAFQGLFRLGFAYQLTNSNWGVYTNFDVSGGYEPLRRFIILGDRGTGLAYNAAFTVGVQYRF